MIEKRHRFSIGFWCQNGSTGSENGALAGPCWTILALKAGDEVIPQEAFCNNPDFSSTVDAKMAQHGTQMEPWRLSKNVSAAISVRKVQSTDLYETSLFICFCAGSPSPKSTHVLLLLIKKMQTNDENRGPSKHHSKGCLLCSSGGSRFENHRTMKLRKD